MPRQPRKPRRPAAPHTPSHPEIVARLQELVVFPKTIPVVLRQLADHGRLDLAYVEAVIAYVAAARNVDNPTALAVSLLCQGFVPPAPAARADVPTGRTPNLTLDELTARTLADRAAPTEPVLTAAERLAILRGGFRG